MKTNKMFLYLIFLYYICIKKHMKPELIDNVLTDTKTEFKVRVWDRFYSRWQYAKPLNYTYNLFTKLKHAYYVLIGKATAFRFFEDFTEEEKTEFVKAKIKERVTEHKRKIADTTSLVDFSNKTQIEEEKSLENEKLKIAEQKKQKITEQKKRKSQITKEKKNQKEIKEINSLRPKSETTYLDYEFTDAMIQEIERYLNAGVLREKIHVTYNPSVCKWSHRKARVLDSTDESFDVVKDKKGNLSADFSKMVLVSLQPHKSLDVKKINNSNGIIITIYNGLYYRFGFIPKQ